MIRWVLQIPFVWNVAPQCSNVGRWKVWRWRDRLIRQWVHSLAGCHRIDYYKSESALWCLLCLAMCDPSRVASPGTHQHHVGQCHMGHHVGPSEEKPWNLLSLPHVRSQRERWTRKETLTRTPTYWLPSSVFQPSGLWENTFRGWWDVSIVRALAALAKDEIRFLAPTWQFPIICNSSFRGCDTLFWAPQTPGLHMVYTSRLMWRQSCNT